MAKKVKGHRYIKCKRKDDGLYFHDQDSKQYYYVCRYLNIKKVMFNLITDDVEVEIEYIQNKIMKSMILPRGNLVRKKLLNILPNKGIDVTDDNVGEVLDYLLYREEQAPKVYMYQQVGWMNLNGERVYLHDHVIGSNLEAEYQGKLNITPKGSLEEWKEVITEEVLGYPPLELALILGLSAPVASLLNKLLGLDILFFHIYGPSSSGKTTALALATSPFGLPMKSNDGLIKTWLATDNAFIGQFKGMHGLPIALDEASTKSKDDYSKLIYQIADGKGKARMTQEGENKTCDTWSGTFIATAENSLLSHSNQNTGLRVRTIEILIKQWTKSAENADNIKRAVVEQYGYAGIAFVERLCQYSDESIIKLYKQAKPRILNCIETKDKYTDRIASKLAIIFLTIHIAKKTFGFNFKTKKIIDILMDADMKQMQDRNIGDKAYEYLKGQIANNTAKFVRSDEMDDNDTKYEVLGKLVAVKGEIKQVLMTRDQLEKLLRAGGFTDSDVILTEWRNNNLIDADKDKFTRRRMMQKGIGAIRVVVINFCEDEIVTEEE